MEIEQAIRLRRSSRQFRARDIAPATVRLLLDLARRAPSSMNGQPWRFVIVRDPAIRLQLAEIKNRHCPPAKRHFRADFLADAPVIVVVCVDRSRSFDRDTENAVLAADHLMLAARARGLASVYMSAHTPGRPRLRADIRRLLRLPEGTEAVSIIPLGYRAGRPEPKTLRDLDEMIVHDRF